MPRKKVKENESETEENIEEIIEEVLDRKELSELNKLHALHKELKDRGINSIGDLEVKIARLQA